MSERVEEVLPELSLAELSERAPGEALLWKDRVLLAESLDHLETFREPCRVRGAVVIVCLGGQLLCRVNHEERLLTPGCMLVNFTSGVIEVLDVEAFSAMACVMSYNYLDFLRIERDHRMDLFMGVRRNAQATLNAPTLESFRCCFALAGSLMRQSAEPVLLDGVFTLLAQLVVKEASKQRNAEAQPTGVESVRGEQLFERFIFLLSEARGTERRVRYYADKLGIIPGHFEAVVKQYSSRTPADWITEYAVAEAKTLLRYSSMSVFEVSERLRFPSQSAFGKFFKGEVGLSPLQWRKRGCRGG